MTRNRLALIVAAAAFLGWMIYLGSEAWRYRHPPVIVSRSQLLFAEFDVTAQVDANPADPAKPLQVVTVQQVLYAADPKQATNAGEKVTIQNLSESIGFVGPGSYILPMQRRNGSFFVASSPKGPIDPGGPPDTKPFEPFKIRIYPDTPEIRQQFADIRAGRG